MSLPTQSKIKKRLSSSAIAIAPFLFYIFLSIVMTWPLARRLNVDIYGITGDNQYFCWLFWWFDKAIFDLWTNPFFCTMINYPHGASLAYNEFSPAMVVLGLPVVRVAGPIAAYNFTVLASFALAGWGVFLWVRRMTKCPPAALAAGAIFAFAPTRMLHAWGHLNLMGSLWFPFYFYSLHILLLQRRIKARHIVMSGVSGGLIALSSQYYLFMTLIVTSIFVAAHLWIYQKRLLPRPKTILNLLLAGCVSAPFILLASAPFLSIAGEGNLPMRTLEEATKWSSSPTDFLHPTSEHFLWGKAAGKIWPHDNIIEDTVYLGWGALAFGLAALALRKKRKGKFSRRLIALMATLTLASIILAMGTYLKWDGKTVDLRGIFGAETNGGEPVYIALPSYYMLKYLPYYDRVRVMMRFGVFASLFLSILAGAGLAVIIEHLKSKRTAWIMGMVAVGIVFFDFYLGPQPMTSGTPEEFNNILASQDEEGSVIVIPPHEGTYPQWTFHMVHHGHPIAHGFFCAYSPTEFQKLSNTLQVFPTPYGVDALQNAGVRYVIVMMTYFKNTEEMDHRIIQAGLQPLGRDRIFYVYKVPDN